MADDDEGFFVAGLDAVLAILNEFPLAGFAADEQVEVGLGEGGNAGFATHVAPAGLDVADGQGGVAEDADGPGVERGGHLLRELAERDGAEGELLGIGWVGYVLLPAELVDHALGDAVGVAHVPVVVEVEEADVCAACSSRVCSSAWGSAVMLMPPGLWVSSMRS